MAHTYHHGLKARYRKFGNSFYSGSPPADDTPPKRRRTKHYCEWMSTPSWWIREFMTRPKRAKEMSLSSKVLALADMEDCPLFPLAKKPHNYYW